MYSDFYFVSDFESDQMAAIVAKVYTLFFRLTYLTKSLICLFLVIKFVFIFLNSL